MAFTNFPINFLKRVVTGNQSLTPICLKHRVEVIQGLEDEDDEFEVQVHLQVAEIGGTSLYPFRLLRILMRVEITLEG